MTIAQLSPMEKEAVENARHKAEELYRTGQFLCSEAVFWVANEYLGHLAPDKMVKLASGFPEGMGFAGCACGALTGGVMALGLKYGRSSTAVETPGMFAASKELHDGFRARRKIACCRALTRKFTLGAPEHIEQFTTITGEVAADVVEILARGDFSQQG